ncbi:MAG: sortase, partial [Chloroflexota bacterium]
VIVSGVTVIDESQDSEAQNQTENTSSGLIVASEETLSETTDASTVPLDVDIEEILGFSLPEESVNSVTEIGLANRIIIPRLNLDTDVLIAPIKDQTWQVDHLEQAVGHLEGTASPGSNSNLVLAGHVTLEGGVYGPFAGLGLLEPGDVILVQEGGVQYEYIIDSHQTVDRTAVEVTYPSDSGKITLITCNNWDHVEGRYIERLIVQGHLVTN